MNKLFLAIAIMTTFAHGAYVHGGLVYDKTTGIWSAASANPERTAASEAAEKRLSERKRAVQEARAKALATTNTVTAIITPGTQTVKGKRVFSKLKCVIALQQMGVWNEVKAWIESNGLYDLYLAAQVFNESDPYFKQGLETLKTQLNLTDEQVESMLQKCIAE